MNHLLWNYKKSQEVRKTFNSKLAQNLKGDNLEHQTTIKIQSYPATHCIVYEGGKNHLKKKKKWDLIKLGTLQKKKKGGGRRSRQK